MCVQQSIILECNGHFVLLLLPVDYFWRQKEPQKGTCRLSVFLPVICVNSLLNFNFLVVSKQSVLQESLSSLSAVSQQSLSSLSAVSQLIISVDYFRELRSQSTSGACFLVDVISTVKFLPFSG